MEVVLDTSFIISCIKRKIPFIQRLLEMGFNRIGVPRRVMQELKDLRTRSPRAEKEAIEIALRILEDNDSIKSVHIPSDNVDRGLVLKGKEGVYIATLDKEIKRNVSNRVVIRDATNSIEIERD